MVEKREPNWGFSSIFNPLWINGAGEELKLGTKDEVMGAGEGGNKLCLKLNPRLNVGRLFEIILDWNLSTGMGVIVWVGFSGRLSEKELVFVENGIGWLASTLV